MRRADVQRSYHQGSTGLPMLNVKDRGGHLGTIVAIREHFKCSENTAQRAFRYAYDALVESFWEGVKEDAVTIFGKRAEVYAEGRSGGWLVVRGLPDVDTWAAPDLGRWAKFARWVRGYMALPDVSELIENIEANRWAEEGSELYNFRDFSGKVVAIPDLERVKREAVAAYVAAL